MHHLLILSLVVLLKRYLFYEYKNVGIYKDLGKQLYPVTFIYMCVSHRYKLVQTEKWSETLFLFLFTVFI